MAVSANNAKAVGTTWYTRVQAKDLVGQLAKKEQEHEELLVRS